MMSKYIRSLIPVLGLCLRLVSGNPQHFVCKNLEDVFVERGPSEAEPRYGQKQGAPGKMGPPGVPGPEGSPGNDGPPGTVDYDRMNEVIRLEVDNRMNCIKQEGLLRSESCFTVPYLSSSRDMTYEQAVAECVKHGAALTEFHNRTQQTALYDFVLGKMPSDSSYVQLFLGMKYNHSTSNLRYRSGMAVDPSQLQWYPSYPKSTSSFEYLFIEVKRDYSSNHGVFNEQRSYRVNGVICERQI